MTDLEDFSFEGESPRSTPSASTPSLNFKPLGEGLGFHLFADGLPYAPRSQNSGTSTSGAGATAAGRPTFAYPASQPMAKPSASSVNSSAADPVAERILRELAKGGLSENFSRPGHLNPSPAHLPGYSKKSIPGGATTQNQKNLSEELARLESHGLGYVFMRFFAYVIDFLFMGSVCASVLSVALLNVAVEEVGYISFEALLTAGAFFLGCVWASIAAQEVAFGTSLGKRIFNLRLKGTGSEVFLRALFFIPSVAFSGLGILMCLADSRKRCWHDRVTQIQPE